MITTTNEKLVGRRFFANTMAFVFEFTGEVSYNDQHRRYTTSADHIITDMGMAL